MKLTFLLFTLLIAACSSTPPQPVPAEQRTAPAPVVTPGTAPALPPPTVQTEKTEAPAPPVRAPSSTATDTLILASTNAAAAGDTRSAITHLERAIRLDGRNAELWARLSTAYLRDGQPILARQYANRALALAGNRGDWKRAAWLAIAELEEHDGNQAEADRIRVQYEAGRG